MDVALSLVFEHLDERSLAFAGFVCRRWNRIAAGILAQFSPHLMAHGSTAGPLKIALLNYLTGAKQLQLAVDQFPHPRRGYPESVLEYIVTNNIEVDLSLGTRDDRTLETLRRARAKVGVIGSFKKMHNKIWVIDEEGVILGSPNVSFSALEGGNIESFIHISSPRVGALIGKYLSLLKRWDNAELQAELRDEIVAYNAEPHDLRLAVAPIFNITDFVIKELTGATRIIIRQFLISPKQQGETGPDIISVLCAMARKKVAIEIYLDEAAYTSKKTGYFVQRAAATLTRAGCKVYTQKPVLVVNVGAEKIQHDKLILAEFHRGVQRTLIGSAGFTRDVICNNNAENFIATDSKAIFASMMTHHNATLSDKVATTLRR